MNGLATKHAPPAASIPRLETTMTTTREALWGRLLAGVRGLSTARSPEELDELDAAQVAATNSGLEGLSLSLRGITKRFPSVLANDDVSFDVHAGEVHALLGENGAGKSTLMKILYGFYQPDEGEILFNGERIRIDSPSDARRLRIGMVFQNFTLIPAMTVVENVSLFWSEQGFVMKRGDLAERIRAVSERYSLDVDPTAYVRDLSMGERQKVELIKLIVTQVRVLICDEPTSVLAPHEVEGLFKIFEELKQDGYAILFITHKLREVQAVADRITVLRRGRVVATIAQQDADSPTLVEMMIGEAAPEAVSNVSPLDHADEADAALSFRSVSTGGKHDRGLQNVSFHVCPGEILGIAGVGGNGQEEFGEILLGLRDKHAGSVLLDGQNVEDWSLSRVLNAGIAYVPEDVVTMGVVPSMSVEENLILGDCAKYDSGGQWLDWSHIRTSLGHAMKDFPVQLPGANLRVGDLSGGNMQRVVLAREIVRNPRVLIAYYPTRGLDVKTTEATRGLLMDTRGDGAAVLLVSEDLDELFAMSDRLVVMHSGSVVGHFRPADTNKHDVGLLMTGQAG
jgi:general nucleoside transport system ATP-binding protein